MQSIDHLAIPVLNQQNVIGTPQVFQLRQVSSRSYEFITLFRRSMYAFSLHLKLISGEGPGQATNILDSSFDNPTAPHQIRSLVVNQDRRCRHRPIPGLQLKHLKPRTIPSTTNFTDSAAYKPPRTPSRLSICSQRWSPKINVEVTTPT